MEGKALAVIALGVALTACSPAVSQRAAVSARPATVIGGDRAAGEKLFQANCAVCHGKGGADGGTIGPSLQDESARMDYDTTVSWIEDPAPPMARLYPKPLDANDVRDVAAYVESL
jgi:ubiquinol-cytochrome c reductase cytochrome c subunit